MSPLPPPVPGPAPREGVPGARPRRTLSGRLLALGGALAVALLGAELFLRYRAHASFQERLEAVHRDPREVSLSSINRLNRNPHIVYELKPGLSDQPFKGVPVSTSSLGFRSPEISVAKPPNTVRIVGLGDSVMFGWGVLEEEGYLAVLERLLREAHPEREWEVVNTGVPGYNTTMEVETLREKGLALDPDVVVLGLIANDLSLPTLLHKKENYLRIDRSWLAKFVRESLGLERPVTDLFIPLDAEEADFERFEHAPDLVAPEYRDMLGWPAFEAALDELARLSRTEGFEVVSMSLWPAGILDKMQRLCRERGFSTTRVVPKPEGLVPGTDWIMERGLKLSVDDPHPSAKLHAMIAANLFEHLEQSGILDRLLE